MDDVDQAIAELEREFAGIAIEFMTEAMANLREDTPKDTTHAAANWVPAKSGPFGNVDGVHTPSRVVRGQPIKGSTTAGEAQRAGLAAILSYTLEDGDMYITNNVRYITGPGSLNDGHSNQAPKMFIEAAIHRAVVTVGTRHNLGIGATYEGSG